MINVDRQQDKCYAREGEGKWKEKFGHALLGLCHTAQIIVALPAGEL